MVEKPRTLSGQDAEVQYDFRPAHYPTAFIITFALGQTKENTATYFVFCQTQYTLKVFHVFVKSFLNNFTS